MKNSTQAGGRVGVPDNTALFVVGHRGSQDLRKVAEPVSDIGRVLLSSQSPWDVHRYSFQPSSPRALEALPILRHLDRLSLQPGRRLLLVLAGEVVETPAGPGLILDPQWQDHPVLTTLLLEPVARQLQDSRSEVYGALLLVRRPSTISREELAKLFAPESNSSNFAIVGDWPNEGNPALLENFVNIFVGEMGDGRRTGVTLRLLFDTLTTTTANMTALVGELQDYIWNLPPSGLDALVKGRVTALERPRAETLEPENLSGMTLPGSVRVEGIRDSGGFGTVYFGRQVGLGGRPVAIKVLHRHWNDVDVAIRMFAEEIAAIARIDSLNVVRIFYKDVTRGGRLFFVMEWLEGVTLRTRLNSDPALTPDQIRLIAQGIFSGLAASHAHGVIHRDIKPENIMLCQTGNARSPRIVLFDFGIAMQHGGDSNAGSDGSGPGTPGYMAPEQFDNPGRVGEKTDIFQAAMVILEMLTAWQRPKGSRELPPIDELLAHDRWWADFLRGCLATDPDRRYSSADQCLTVLKTNSLDVRPEVSPKTATRFLDAYAEKDRFRFFGRDEEAVELTERILYHNLVVFSAPSGMGKSSLLRTLVVPNLKSLGRDVVYLSCRTPMRRTLIHRLNTDPVLQIQPLIDEGSAGFVADGGNTPRPSPTRNQPTLVGSEVVDSAADLLAALTRVLYRRQRGLVLILDQAESILTADDGVLDELFLHCQRSDLGLSIVLGIRDDAMGVFLGGHPHIRNQYELVQIGLLNEDAARRVATLAFRDQGLVLDVPLQEVLVQSLLDDGATLARKLRWPQSHGIYPPHLQIVVSALVERVRTGLRLDNWIQKGAFPLQSLLDDYVETVLRSGFDKTQLNICTTLFAELTVDFERRRARSMDDLVSAIGSSAGGDSVRSVLKALVHHRILMPITTDDGGTSVEITHDNLLRILERWVDTHDLGRRRAKEILRYHLQRAAKDGSTYLNKVEILDVLDKKEVIAEVDEERTRLGHTNGMTASRLVQRSQRRQRSQYAAIAAGVILTIAAIVAFREYTQRHELLRVANIGRFPLDLSILDTSTAGDWVIGPITDFPDLNLRFFQPGLRTWFGTGVPVVSDTFQIERDPSVVGRFWVEGPGVPVDIVVSGRHRAGENPCDPSIIRRADLPGVEFRDRDDARRTLVVPSCATTQLDLVKIPAGVYNSGDKTHDDAFPKREIFLSEYAIDRVEVSNAWYTRFFDAVGTLVRDVRHEHDMVHSEWANEPKLQISWPDALAYCEWMGKTLPSAAQAEKAGRGGRWLDGDLFAHDKNDNPFRRYPTGDSLVDSTGQLLFTVAVAPAGAPKIAAIDRRFSAVSAQQTTRSPYGVLHLVGNASEWRADSGKISAWTTAAEPLRDPVMVDPNSLFRFMEPSHLATLNAEQVLISAWDVVDLDNRRAYLGFRCGTRQAGIERFYSF